MSTYVISDIHGHKKEFDKMLKKIKFSSEDTLYILGDIFDKGEESGLMMRWAVDEAPKNIKFLLGNHEDMAYSALRHSGGHPSIRYGDIWGKNKGWETLEQLIATFDGRIDDTQKWINKKLCPWIEKLPLCKYLTVNGNHFMLVHAGFNPQKFKMADLSECCGFHCDGNYEHNARWENVDAKHGFGIQYSQDMLWARGDWILDKIDPPCTVIFGHSYISKNTMGSLKSFGAKMRGGGGRIVHIKNKKICIDCGCAYTGSDLEGIQQGLYRLACLRLDDMKEFYVKVEAPKK